jgi:predicted Zn finger-like uncharacterized protein
MDHRITQCPRCGTSFRVTEAHLAVAAGAVRCGSCLHIFNAREHWAIEPQPVAEPEPSQPETEPDPDDIVIDDDALFDDNTPIFAEERTIDRPPVEAEPADRLFNEVDFGAADEFGRTEPQAGDDDFSLIADTPEELDNSFTDLGSWDDSSTRFGRVQDLDEELSASDEEWTRDLLRDDELDTPFAAEAPAGQAAAPEPLYAGDGPLPPLEDFGLAAAQPDDGRREPTFGEELADSETTPLADGLFLDEEQGPGREPDLAEQRLVDDQEPDEEPSLDDEHGLDEAPPFSAAPGYGLGPQAPHAIDPIYPIDDRGARPADPLSNDLNPEFLETPPAHRPAETELMGAEHEPGPKLEHEETIVTDASYAATAPLASTAYARVSLRTPDTPAQSPEELEERDPLASLDRLAAEPLQIQRFRHEPRWPKVLWGLGLIAMLLLLLTGQYIYRNFDELATGPARPWLLQACAMAGCDLPPQADASLIRSGNLIVRSHPTRQGALVVDAIITNLASFPQPYPQLQLQFSDINGAPVAGRRFQPAEYLAGELSGASLMPVQQPVHIALELVDPGPQAVNYALTVVPVTPVSTR